MWKCSKDAFKDFSQFNDFGLPNEIDLQEAPGNKSAPCGMSSVCEKFLDPRTGEEIDPWTESQAEFCESRKIVSARGRGRGWIMRESDDSSGLRKQLRMTRPLGLGNEMIESYFTKREKEIRTGGEKPAGRDLVGSRRVTKSKNVLITSLLRELERKEDGMNRDNKEGSDDGTLTSKKVHESSVPEKRDSWLKVCMTEPTKVNAQYTFDLLDFPSL